jgi:hypothetical protein
MAKPGGLIGMDALMQGLNNRLSKMNAYSLNGMREVAAIIREDMEKTPPVVPVDTGNLRASWFTEFVKRVKGGFGMIFGFGANYAFWVHENINPEVKWNRAGSGPKFLQAAIKRNFKRILMILGNSMKQR